MFIIDPCDEASIYKAEKQLRNIFNDICENDTSTHWLIEEILQALRAH